MKIHPTKRHRESGSVLLPFQGAVLFGPVWLSCMLVFLLCASNLAKSYPLLAGVGTIVLIVPCSIALMFAAIAAAIFGEVSEGESERIGLGAGQYWKGRTITEKLMREITRLLLFGGSGLCAWLIWNALAPRLLEYAPSGMQNSGMWFMVPFGIWQILLMLLFVPILLLKSAFPKFAFEGDPNATPLHVW